ncbi:hypothetical protein [Acetobacterium sp.]|uniref:hypothetical protein n=1 Tax=Acetobacterium sp. TaxID=1872094 RepID=UPI002F40E684
MSSEVITKTKEMIDQLKNLSHEEFYKGLELYKSSTLSDSRQSDDPVLFESNGRINTVKYEALLEYADQSKIIAGTLKLLDVFEDLDWIYNTQIKAIIKIFAKEFDNDLIESDLKDPGSNPPNWDNSLVH